MTCRVYLFVFLSIFFNPLIGMQKFLIKLEKLVFPEERTAHGKVGEARFSDRCFEDALYDKIGEIEDDINTRISFDLSESEYYSSSCLHVDALYHELLTLGQDATEDEVGMLEWKYKEYLTKLHHAMFEQIEQELMQNGKPYLLLKLYKMLSLTSQTEKSKDHYQKIARDIHDEILKPATDILAHLPQACQAACITVKLKQLREQRTPTNKTSRHLLLSELADLYRTRFTLSRDVPAFKDIYVSDEKRASELQRASISAKK